MLYKTVRCETQIEFEEKKSIFIASIKRVNNEEEAKSFIGSIKIKHKDANHNVPAYVIGATLGVQRYSDDGEPQGTAGIPVLEVIKKNSVTDVVIVVTRYFGGILLGAGGLCRAYSKAAAEAVKAAGIVEKVEGAELLITIDYDLLGTIQHRLKERNWVIENIEYADKVCLHIYVEQGKIPLIKEFFKEITANRFDIKVRNEGFYFREEERLYIIDRI